MSDSSSSTGSSIKHYDIFEARLQAQHNQLSPTTSKSDSDSKGTARPPNGAHSNHQHFNTFSSQEDRRRPHRNTATDQGILPLPGVPFSQGIPRRNASSSAPFNRVYSTYVPPPIAARVVLQLQLPTTSVPTEDSRGKKRKTSDTSTSHHSDIPDGRKLGFAAVYAPNSAAERTILWAALETALDNSKTWIVVGDFNMISSPLDQAGGSLATGDEISHWKNLLQTYDLVDTFNRKEARLKFTWDNRRHAILKDFLPLNLVLAPLEQLPLLPWKKLSVWGSKVAGVHNIARLAASGSFARLKAAGIEDLGDITADGRAATPLLLAAQLIPSINSLLNKAYDRIVDSTPRHTASYRSSSHIAVYPTENPRWGIRLCEGAPDEDIRINSSHAAAVYKIDNDRIFCSVNIRDLPTISSWHRAPVASFGVSQSSQPIRLLLQWDDKNATIASLQWKDHSGFLSASNVDIRRLASADTKQVLSRLRKWETSHHIDSNNKSLWKKLWTKQRPVKYSVLQCVHRFKKFGPGQSTPCTSPFLRRVDDLRVSDTLSSGRSFRLTVKPPPAGGKMAPHNHLDYMDPA
ncbi:hypothetical protein R1sor_008519 [Riccia sorocarpa]|uniref:DNase I-like protein n=1 Tax=Riccia sorocarpa TaxID=122646 RepID=A0ABD3HU27_9MARC